MFPVRSLDFLSSGELLGQVCLRTAHRVFLAQPTSRRIDNHDSLNANGVAQGVHRSVDFPRVWGPPLTDVHLGVARLYLDIAPYPGW
jgi:hypothetical protein